MTPTVAPAASGDTRFVKWYTLVGVVPLGVFLLLYLGVNARAFQGREAFNDLVLALERTLTLWGQPLLPWLEVFGVFIPLLFHVSRSVKLACNPKEKKKPAGEPETPGKSSVLPFSERWAHLLHPVAGGVALGFIALLLWQFRVPLLLGTLHPSDYYDELCARFSSTQLAVPWTALAYLSGLAASVFYWRNNVQTCLIARTLTPNQQTPRWADRLLNAVGVALFLLGASIVVYYATGSRLL